MFPTEAVSIPIGNCEAVRIPWTSAKPKTKQMLLWMFFFQAYQVARLAKFNLTKSLSLSLSLPKPMCNSAAGLVDDQIDLT